MKLKFKDVVTPNPFVPALLLGLLLTDSFILEAKDMVAPEEDTCVVLADGFPPTEPQDCNEPEEV